MGEVNEAVIKKTQQTLGKYVKRPPLTEKLLMKPPFRFLHDVVNVVIKETGFLRGLYTADELKSENIRDRDAKIKFLEKLINIVEMVTKEELKVRPSKIVAGQEAEKTNELLQAIGMAIERKLDSKAAIEAAKADSAPKKSTKAPVAKTKPTAPVKTTQKTTTKPEKTAEKKVKPSERAKEKPKSEEKVKTKVEAKAPKKDSVVQKNEKNRKDPDKKRIDSGIKLEDSPNEQELNPEDSPKGIQLTLEATPQIVSEEPPKISEKAQEKASEKLPDSKPVEKPPEAEKVEKIIQDAPKERDELVDVIDEEAERRRKEKRSSKSRNQEEAPPPPENVAEVEEPPRDEEVRPESHQRKRTKSSEKKVKKKDGKEEKEAHKPKELAKQSSVDGSGKIQNVPRPKTSLRPPSVRPASARPGAPRRRDRNVEIVLQPEETIKMGDISVKMENFSIDLEDDGENLIIIEDSTNREDLLPSAPIESVDGQEHGHLVQQILETQKGLTGGKVDDEKKPEEWSDRRTRQASAQQMDALREAIQKLTRAVNPLGKLMNFLQEDIDSMQREYNMWREMHQMALNELNRERSSTQPSTDALKQLEASIVEHTELIDISRANILQNEQKIARLLTDT
ncbi:TRAF3-interacting protein 1 [Lutzomyia longipalpis]|uniref:TRAF3-interacting protein 1 n=1 Tax=Lutzomyia longipalpis TaxID=7200 RepID=UPI002483D984|nr:TRAF3-interacting protein 1 [Lutzomyia longipalpis]